MKVKSEPVGRGKVTFNCMLGDGKRNYVVRLYFNDTFIFRNVLEEDIYVDVLISLVPFVSIVSKIIHSNT